MEDLLYFIKSHSKNVFTADQLESMQLKVFWGYAAWNTTQLL